MAIVNVKTKVFGKMCGGALVGEEMLPYYVHESQDGGILSGWLNGDQFVLPVGQSVEVPKSIYDMLTEATRFEREAKMQLRDRNTEVK